MSRKPNVELLEQVYSLIKSDRKRWFQGSWARAKAKRKTDTVETCNTAMCFAGHAVALAGAKIKWESSDVFDRQFPVWEASQCRLPHRGTEMISDAAQRILRLNSYQADALFDGNNKLKDIRKVLDRIESGDLFAPSYDWGNYWNNAV